MVRGSVRPNQNFQVRSFTTRVSSNPTQWKTPFYMACKEGQFDVVKLMLNNQLQAFSINLNARHVNGMTHFD